MGRVTKDNVEVALSFVILFLVLHLLTLGFSKLMPMLSAVIVVSLLVGVFMFLGGYIMDKQAAEKEKEEK